MNIQKKQTRLLLVTLSMLISLNIKAQDTTKLTYYNGDTLLYFQKVFEANKNSYINKPLSVLLDKLEMKSYFYEEAINRKNANSTTGINLFFINQNKYDGLFFNKIPIHTYRLDIKFLNFPPEDSVMLYIQKEHFNWGRYSKKFYMKYVIKDFKLWKF